MTSDLTLFIVDTVSLGQGVTRLISYLVLTFIIQEKNPRNVYFLKLTPFLSMNDVNTINMLIVG